jgi:hypothetical protein
MGFTGVSYRAGGWEQVGDEAGTTYRYVDGDYVSDRVLLRRLGVEALMEHQLTPALGERYSRSRMCLAPLRIFGHPC